MGTYKNHKGVTEHYTSLEELRAAWGKSPVIRQTRDKAKLESQREHFLKDHICSACKKPMTWTGGNVMTCQNPDCKGIKRENRNSEQKFHYVPSYHLLNEKDADKAKNLFTEYNFE